MSDFSEDSPIPDPVISNRKLVCYLVKGQAYEKSGHNHSTENWLDLPDGVDLDAFPAGEPIPDDGPLRLLYVAHLIECKGQHHLIEAVKRLTETGIDVTLDLVGTGDAEAALKALARALELEDRVHFRGYIPREEIATHHAAAHVFVLRSYEEGMSTAKLEAMAARLPIVVARTGDTLELVEEGVNGFVFDWADVTTLADYLRRLATDRELARRMSAASRSRARQFSWETPAEQYLELFTGFLT